MFHLPVNITRNFAHVHIEWLERRALSTARNLQRLPFPMLHLRIAILCFTFSTWEVQTHVFKHGLSVVAHDCDAAQRAANTSTITSDARLSLKPLRYNKCRAMLPELHASIRIVLSIGVHIRCKRSKSDDTFLDDDEKCNDAAL